jgi:diaminopropionate ammonia-lyase
MAMLECQEPSGAAWRILSRAADAFLALEEEAAIEAMRRLASPGPDEFPLIAGESGGVGVAGLLRAAAEPAIRAALGLDPESRVLTINTEGATDPERYRRLAGRRPSAAARPEDAGATIFSERK